MMLNGANVTHVFLTGYTVRAEIDVARLLPLMAAPTRLRLAVTVPNPASWRVNLLVLLDHEPTDEDLMAAQNLGGQVLSRANRLKFYNVLIEDARVPELRALRGVLFVETNSVVCVGLNP